MVVVLLIYCLVLGPTFDYDSISYSIFPDFPLNDDIFNDTADYFCAEKGIPYGKATTETTLGNSGGNPGHKAYVLTKSALGSSRGGATGDIDSSVYLYVDSSLNLVVNTGAISGDLIGYLEHNATETDTVITNWAYKAEPEEKWNCEDGGEKLKMAFLLACFKSGTSNNEYQRIPGKAYHNDGSYEYDVLQSAVWNSWLATVSGSAVSNELEMQANTYLTYHTDVQNPQINVIPDDNVGTVLESGTYKIGPFTMSSYVRASDDKYKLNIITGTTYAGRGTREVTLQEVFNNAASASGVSLDDVKGDIIKVEAILTDGTTESPRIDITNKLFDASGAQKGIEPNLEFYIHLTESETGDFDELQDIIFTYQEVHAYAKGTKYKGIQYEVEFKSTNPRQGCDEYVCQCSGCSGTKLTYAQKLAGEKHNHKCSTTGYCQYGYTSSSFGTSCSTSTVCGQTAHTHGSGCNSSACTHACSPFTGCTPTSCAHTHTSSCCSLTEHTHTDSCKSHTCTLNYCSHGHENGEHVPGACKSWGATHHDKCDAKSYCTHNHEICDEFTWQKSSETDICQDGFTGAGKLTNKLVEWKVKVAVPLKTKMTIYKYITKVDHNVASGDDAGRPITVADRSTMDKADKEADSVKIERGDTVTYTVKIKNESRFPTEVKLEDVFPEADSEGNRIEDVEFDPNEYKTKIKHDGTPANSNADWIEVPEKNEVTIKIKLKALQKTGKYENNIKFITTNDGTEHMRYVKWGAGSTNGEHEHGNIVNTADPVRDDDSDWYEIKQYDISVDKYVTKVEHQNTGTNGEKVIYDSTARKNKDNEADEKEANPVLIESGDIVTYTIDIYNTKDPYLSNSTKNRNEDPFWDPDLVYVKLEDILPTNSTIKSITISDSPNTASSFPIDDIKVKPGEITTVTAEVIVKQAVSSGTNSDSNMYTNVDDIYWTGGSLNQSALRIEKNTAKLDKDNVKNLNRKVIKNNSSKPESSDWIKFKEYSVSLDKYITEVKHDTNSVKTYDSTSRKQQDNEDVKRNDPVYAEYGDVVTYNIDIYNTTSPYCTGRAGDPYYNPNLVYVDVEDTLPRKFSSLTVTVSNSSGSITTTSTGFKAEGIEVPADGITTITVTLIVEERDRDTLEENNIKIISKIKNVNKCEGVNHGTKINTSDWYKINDYKLSVDKYISGYLAEMTKFNEDNNFAKEENELKIELTDARKTIRANLTDAEKAIKPVQAEKTETLIYSIVMKNEAVDSGLKKATQIRPTKITDTMDKGLKIKQESGNYLVEAKIYNSAGSVKFESPSNFSVTVNEVLGVMGGGNTYTFEIPNKTNSGEYLILDPGDYIVYDVQVTVVESNMALLNLSNEAYMNILTNINNDTKDRIVYEDSYIMNNIAAQQNSKEYVKMKDLVIAGKVWLDKDKNGNMDCTGSNAVAHVNGTSTDPNSIGSVDRPMSNILVKLYQVGIDGPIRTTYTDNTGLFTFGRDDSMNYRSPNNYVAGVTESDQRIPKATNKDANLNYSSNSALIEYYIEYEYDGVVYKSTEIYADNSHLDNNGDLIDNYKTDSNAYEFKDVRANYNNSYEIVSYNKAHGAGVEHDLLYDKQGHNSYITLNIDRPMVARSFITKGSNKDISNTKTLWLFPLSSDGKPETEYLKYINLGLEEREDVDLSITQDIYEIKTTINGEEMTYEYNQNKYALQKGEVTESNVLDTSNSKDIDKEQEKPSELTDFDSPLYRTGGESEMKYYEFEYYLEDYNYRISQYHTDTVRAYKGSPLRQFGINDVVNDGGIMSNLMPGGTGKETGRESELNTELTFRIKVTNNAIKDDEPNTSTPDIQIFAGINEIVEYYDKNLVDLVLDGTTVKGFNIKNKDTNGFLVDHEVKVVDAKLITNDNVEHNVTLSATSLYGIHPVADQSILYIRPVDDCVLAEGESVDILITFVVDKEKETDYEMQTILGKISNIAEISTYSTYYDRNKTQIAGLIDKDSNPGNYGLDTNVGAYEDDTFETGIELKVATEPPPPPPPPPNPEEDNTYEYKAQRTLSGFVWDDARSEEVRDENGTQYVGDGKFDPNVKANDKARKNTAIADESEDSKVAGVQAQLIEYIKMPDPDNSANIRIYEDIIYANGEYSSGNAYSIMETRTNSEGKYQFSGYVPGEYIVRFNYGDNENIENMLIFNGQDYKSTTYTSIRDGEYADKISNSDTKLECLEQENLSDAKDDEIRRLEVIGYSETMTNSKNLVLKGKDTTDSGALTTNTSMNADTVDFLVTPEKAKATESSTRIWKYKVYNKTITEKSETARFVIKNIDFGLQYRPEQQIVLNKYIENITITTSDSNGSATDAPILDAYFEPYYGIVKNTDFITGLTTFVTDRNGNIIPVKNENINSNPGIKADVENALADGTDGINYLSSAGAQINNDGKYVVAIAGTRLIADKSVGLNNLQFLETAYNTDDNGNRTFNYDNGTYFIDSVQGFAYINIDDTIMQGATIKVKYFFTGNNISEIDRVSKNLSNLRFSGNDAVQKYSEYTDYYDEEIYQQYGNTKFINQVYSPAKTARNALFSEYYRYEIGKTDTKGNEILYKVKDKDLNVTTNNKKIEIEDIDNPYISHNGYYARYLGSTYYTGVINENKEVVSTLKLDKVIDYIDNDMVFNGNDNNSENNLWTTTTPAELFNSEMLNGSVYSYLKNGTIERLPDNRDINLNPMIIDADHREYATAIRSNLAVTVDDSKKDEDPNAKNKEFSKFLLSRYSNDDESCAKISLVASKVIAAEDKTDDMVYENIAEIIQYTSVTGRITNIATTIGNAIVEGISSKPHTVSGESPEFYQGRIESDTASVEKITLTPPTGLDRVHRVVQNVVKGTSYTVITIIGVSLVCVAILASITIYHKRRIK